MAEFSKGFLMCRDVPVFEVLYDPSNGAIVDVSKVLCREAFPWPARKKGGLVDLSGLRSWWASRFVPQSRLPHALEQDSALAVLFEANMGLSLADQYWIAPSVESFRWHDLNYFENEFDDKVGRELLDGPDGAAFDPSRHSGRQGPSLATNGMLPKFWRVGNDGSRQLCKRPSPSGLESVFETAVTSGLKAMISTSLFTEYWLEPFAGEGQCICRAFTDEQTAFVPACDVVPDETMSEGGSAALLFLKEFAASNGIEGANEFLDMMMAIDVFFGNDDRHFGNFGFLWDSTTFRIASFAPLFDMGGSFCFEQTGSWYAPFAPSLNWQAEKIVDLDAVCSLPFPAAISAVEEELLSAAVEPSRVETIVASMEYQADLLASVRDSRHVAH